MKTIKIKISDAEYKGIINYLKSTSFDISPKVNKSDVTNYVNNEISGLINSGACGDYIKYQINKQTTI